MSDSREFHEPGCARLSVVNGEYGICNCISYIPKYEGIPEVIETFDKLKELHIKKNQDYTGESPDPFFNFNVSTDIHSLFKNEQDKTYATMIGIKLGRISALLNSGKEPNNESLLDSFDDLIVYTALWKANLMRRTKE